ncbi:8821_t:CDS:2 [Entrophospora sp. SA101]|nr:1237_t:CDS:2 [Entrophospora sp. SA101]CAJ0634962.1 8821_t:CDS:2 [Entrophospora sp. SA101]CAJ0829580.1 2263_t:CDS:2 [Entrophospora sp. SA101]
MSNKRLTKIHWCPQCHNSLRPIFQRDINLLLLKCRCCKFSQEATEESYKIFSKNYTNEIRDLKDEITQETLNDPTMKRSLIKCDKCFQLTEAVEYHANSNESIKVIYVCEECMNDQIMIHDENETDHNEYEYEDEEYEDEEMNLIRNDLNNISLINHYNNVYNDNMKVVDVYDNDEDY